MPLSLFVRALSQPRTAAGAQVCSPFDRACAGGSTASHNLRDLPFRGDCPPLQHLSVARHSATAPSAALCAQSVCAVLPGRHILAHLPLLGYRGSAKPEGRDPTMVPRWGVLLLVTAVVVAEGRPPRRRLDNAATRELRREGKKGGKNSGNDSDDAKGSAGPRSTHHASAQAIRLQSRIVALAGGATSPMAPAAASAAAPAAEPAAAASPGCCWSFNDATKRYQYYPRPANTACVAPYKPAACPGATKPPPPPLVEQSPSPVPSQSVASSLSPPPPPPPPVQVETRVASRARDRGDSSSAGHGTHDSKSVEAATAVISSPATASPPPAKTGGGAGAKKGGGGGAGDTFMMFLLFLGGAAGAYVFRRRICAVVVRHAAHILPTGPTAHRPALSTLLCRRPPPS